MPDDRQPAAPDPRSPTRRVTPKRILGFSLKLAISFGLIAYIISRIGRQAQWGDFVDRLSSISIPWLVLAFVAQVSAMVCTVVRWKLLLEGQEMQVPLRHLVGAFMIGRFVGTFAPSTTGLDIYRMYDIARHSGQTARAVSVVLVEKVIGFFVLSMLVLLTLPWGFGVLPASGLATIAVFFLVPVSLALLLLVRPSLIQRFLTLFFRPDTPLGRKVQKATSAVTTYEKQRGKLVRAVLVGFPVHVFTVSIYVCTGMAIGANVSVADMLFVGPLVITATLVPISLSGLGVREATSVFLLARVGIPTLDAALLAFLVYLVGRALSMLGAFVWLARRSGYRVAITGRAMEEAAAEAAAEAATEATAGSPEAPRRRSLHLGAVGRHAPHCPPDPRSSSRQSRSLPSLGDVHRYLEIGLGAGLLAGIAAGLIEMTYILLRVAPPRQWASLGYAAALYGLVCAVAGGAFAIGWWALGRFFGERHGWLRPRAAALYSATALMLFTGLALAVARFRIFRDAFDERLPPMSAGGLAVQLGLLVAAVVVFAAGIVGLMRLLRSRRGRFLLRPWGTPAVALVVVAIGFAAGLCSGSRAGAAEHRPPYAGPRPATNVILLMIDTLRVDELGAYNPERRGQSEAIDALARQGVVFEQAFAQASWTRPSVASVLTGRFPTAHGSVHKDDALPDAAPTIAELLRDRGYVTAGIVTNYNLAPDFNFQQGFDEYVYLEPRRLLWADDTTAKLALCEIARILNERYLTGAHDVDRYYQDAQRATDEALEWLDRRPGAGEDRPFFLFVQYMDPHDPYFPHDGTGDVYGHAIDPNPPAAARDRIVELYRGEIAYTDLHVGRLLDGLRDRGLADSTTVVLWADHGEEFLDHGDWWHGTTLYDEQVHVPLIVKPAKMTTTTATTTVQLKPGMRISGWVSLIDIPWTLLTQAGYSPNELVRLGYQGADLFQPRETPLVFMEEDHQGNVLRGLRYVAEDGQAYKFIEADAIARPGLRPRELYCVERSDASPDLTAQAVARREQDDQVAQRPEAVAEGRRRVAQPAEAARLAALPRQQVEVADADIERLKALGYIQDDQPPASPSSASAGNAPEGTDPAGRTLCAP